MNPCGTPLLVQVVAVLAIAGATCAQDVLGLVRSESGRPIDGAVVRFVPDAIAEPACATWLQAAEGSAQCRTDANGRFRMAVPARPGGLLIEHANGLGAVVPRVAPGNPIPIVARALGSVVLDVPAATPIHVRLLRGLEPALGLGAREGPELRLAAGRYLLFAATADGLHEIRVDVESGRRTSVRVPTGGIELHAVDGAELHLGRWPDLPIRSAGPRRAVLAGPDIVRVVFDDGGGRRRIVESWCEASPWHAPAPPSGTWHALRVETDGGAPVPGATVLTVEMRAGHPILLAVGDAPSTAHWRPATDDAPRHVLVRADGFVARELPTSSIGDVVRLAVAKPGRLRIEGPDGEPVTDARATFRSKESRLLDAVRHADTRGIVLVPDTTEATQWVDISSDSFLPQSTEVSFSGTGIATVSLRAGARIIGRAWFADEAPAVGVEIELRDPSGELAISPRTTVVGPDGTFAFRGLPDGLFTLFARTLREGHTWSALVRGVQPGPDEWSVRLRDEDPAPPDRRRDR